MIKELIKQLHAGASPQEVKERFKQRARINLTYSSGLVAIKAEISLGIQKFETASNFHVGELSEEENLDTESSLREISNGKANKFDDVEKALKWLREQNNYMTWTIVLPSTFKKGYRKHSGVLQNKADEIIRKMVTSNHPKSFGDKKKGKIQECYSIDWSSDCRILFTVAESSREIHYLRMQTQRCLCYVMNEEERL